MPVTHRSHLLDPEQDTALVGAGEAFQGEEQAAASRSISGSKLIRGSFCRQVDQAVRAAEGQMYVPALQSRRGS